MIMIGGFRAVLLVAALFPALCLPVQAAADETGEFSDIEGLVGGVLVANDDKAADSLTRVTGLVFKLVGRDDSDEYVIPATFPLSGGQRLFLGQLPAGTYDLSGLVLRKVSPERHGDQELTIPLSGDDGRLSVLPGVLTDLGVLAVHRRNTGVAIQIRLSSLSSTSRVETAQKHHPQYQSYPIEEIRGWDVPIPGDHSSARAYAPLSVPLRGLSGGQVMAPTVFGDLAVRDPLGEWFRLPGPVVGRINIALETPEGAILVGGEGGLFIGEIGTTLDWEEVLIDDSVFSVLDASLRQQALILVVERRKQERRSVRYARRGKPVRSTRSVAVLRMPWPEADQVEELASFRLRAEADSPVPTVLTSHEALIRIDRQRYERVSLNDDRARSRIGDIEDVHAQPPHVFIKPAASHASGGVWSHAYDVNLDERLVLSSVRPLQPPIVMPDGELLVHGRVLDEQGVRPVGYYLSGNAGESWRRWSDSIPECKEGQYLYVVGDALYQHCLSGLVFRTGLEQPDWVLEEHVRVPSVAPGLTLGRERGF